MELCSKALFKKYVKSRKITIRLWSKDFLQNFSQKCSKNFRYASQKIIILCLRLVKKKIHSANNFPKMPKILLGHFQKQLPVAFLWKRCSWKFCKIHRKSPVMESLLVKVALLQSTTLSKKQTPAQACSYEFCDCSVFHYFKRGFSLCISFCRIL